jgi:hypothetical protein
MTHSHKCKTIVSRIFFFLLTNIQLTQNLEEKKSFHKIHIILLNWSSSFLLKNIEDQYFTNLTIDIIKLQEKERLESQESNRVNHVNFITSFHFFQLDILCMYPQ